MVNTSRNMAIQGIPWAGTLTFLGLGITLAAYYVSPQVWIAVPPALLFVALAVLRLDLALVFVIFTAPFYLFPKYFGDLSFSLTEFTTLACFTALIIKKLRCPVVLSTLKLRSIVPILRNPVFIFAFAATLSLLVSEFPKYSLREYRTTIIEPLLFYLALLSLPLNRTGIWRFLDAFVLLGAAMAAFSIYHYYFVGVVEATGGVRRVLAIYHSPNALALFLGRVAPPAFFLALLGGRLSGRKHLVPFYALASLLIGFALFLTYSRGAWLAVAVSLISMLILWAFLDGRGTFLRMIVWLAGGMAGVLVAILALASFFPVLSPGRLLSQATDLERLYLWQSAIAMIKDHAVLGVGLDNFLYQYPRYMLPEAWAEPNVSHPHNLILDFWLRIGLLGLLSFIAMQYSFWRSGIRMCRKVADTEIVIVAIVLMGIMADVIIHGLLDNSFFLIDLAVVFWFIYGLMQIAEREGI